MITLQDRDGGDSNDLSRTEGYRSEVEKRRASTIEALLLTREPLACFGKGRVRFRHV